MNTVECIQSKKACYEAFIRRKGEGVGSETEKERERQKKQERYRQNERERASNEYKSNAFSRSKLAT
jgi:hypothetical protein